MTARPNAVRFNPFAAGEIALVVPTTAAQREIWLAMQATDDATLAYNESCVLRMVGALDRAALDAAFATIIGRHDALRSTFAEDGLSLFVNREWSVPIEWHDWSDRPRPEALRRLEATRDEAVRRPFDLHRGPLVRATVVRLAADDHALILTSHHLVCDGWSLGVVTDELGACYRAIVDGVPFERPVPAQYAEYAAREVARTASPDGDADLGFWVRQFATVPAPLSLPTDRPRRVPRRVTSARVDAVLPAALVADIRRLAAATGGTTFGVLFAGFSMWLSRLTGDTDFVVGIPAAGQSAADMPSLVGHCVNLLPVRVTLSPDAPADACIRGVQDSLFAALEHQEYTFGSLLRHLALRRDAGRTPLVDVTFNVDRAAELDFGALKVSSDVTPRAADPFDLTVNLTPIGGGYRIECQYATALFAPATITAWLEAYVELLRQLADAASQPMASIPWVSTPQLERLRQWNDTGSATTGRADALIRAQARRSPDHPALAAAGHAAWSYEELITRTDALADGLLAAGVRPGDRVGLCLERGPKLVKAMLAVWSVGAAYVPLEAAYPAQRLRTMLGDAQVSLVVVDESTAAVAAAWEITCPIAPIGDLMRRVSPAERRPRPVLSPSDEAYVMYTSGSTGVPKGVSVPHSAVANFLVGITATIPVRESDRLLAVTTLGFDIAVLELLGPLVVGGTVIVAAAGIGGDAAALATVLAESGSTLVQGTPTMFGLLIASGWPGMAKLRVLVGGEPLPTHLAQELVARCGDVWNVYGPTEATVWATAWPVEAADDAVRIGRPLPGLRVHVLDAQGQRCPIGVPGELVIEGAGLATGYVNDAAQTAQRFAPSAALGGVRVYRTGDRGRWHADGALEHLGRLDAMVKLRGHRIEPGEIEQILARHPSVRQVLVRVVELATEDARLIAYVAADASPHLSDELLALARRHLPPYMIPQRIVFVPVIPTLPSGKVDHRALLATLEAGTGRTGARLHEPPATPLERVVASEMEQLLHLEQIERHDDFFLLGGHSLLAVKLVARLSARLGHRIPLRAVLLAPSVRALAEWIEVARADAPASLRLVQRAHQQTAPLSPMQERLWYLEQLRPGTPMYNTPSGHRLHGSLDRAAFERAFADIVQRQSVFRTVFDTALDAEPMQRIVSDADPITIELEDLSALASDVREATLERRLAALAEVPFDLRVGPLYRVRLFRLAPDEHVFFLMLHHALWDGWSFDIFYREFSHCYAARRRGETPRLPRLPFSYGDVASALREDVAAAAAARDLRYWTQRLAGAPRAIELPADRPRPLQQSGRGVTNWLNLSPEIADAVRRTAQHAGTTSFALLVSAYAVLLSRLSGSADVVIGTPVRGRAQPELESVMGLFVNTLPLRMTVDDSRSVFDFVSAVGALVRSDLAHPDVSLDQLVRALNVPPDEQRHPLYQAVFSYQDGRGRETQWGDLRHEPNFVRHGQITEDIRLGFVERENGLRGALTYNTDVFDERTMIEFARCYESIVRELLSDGRRLISTVGAAAAAAGRHAVVSGAAPAQAQPLAELTSAVAALDGVADAAVVLQRDDLGEARIVAYLACRPGVTYTASDVRAHVRRRSPTIGVPAFVQLLPQIPRLPDGRVDLAELPNPYAPSASAVGPYVPPATGVEQRLSELWCDLLMVERAGRNDNFFRLGGHSLLSLRASARIEREFGVAIGVRAFITQTLGQIAEEIERRAGGRLGSRL
ncbi:MAG: amino acid adenylation domain-containing protein [Gemmatimonadaceae bacterium]|nr:amino acid adenylation domain-containing protein [Gemmatimonadaceae bacterium]